MDKIAIPESDADLLGECDVDTFRAGGKGGQHQNKTESAVRLTHRPSGIVVTCRADRSQHRNKALALVWLRHKLEDLNIEEKERVPTKTPRSLKRRILDTKRRTGQKKRLRAKPSAEE